jgi:hypothetical protein
MFFHVETAELDDIEVESAEGMPARTARRKSPPTARASSNEQLTDARNARNGAAGRAQLRLRTDENRPFRFATATDSRRQSPMSR